MPDRKETLFLRKGRKRFFPIITLSASIVMETMRNQKGEKRMKILLCAINAKYIHSNLAVYSLRAYAGKYEEQIEIAEFTINHYVDDIMEEIYRQNPDFLGFSCYIWNIEYVKKLIRELKKLLPDTVIWVGGPEVSYDAASFLKEMFQVKGVMTGEGERSFLALLDYYIEGKGTLQEIDGITYRKEKGEIGANPCADFLTMDELPFMYQNMSEFKNKIVYYESSRGCPFSCSYCLSSIDKKVRFRSLDLVERELQFFLDQKVPQVKFVDRTFNCNHRHAVGIWNYIKEHDNGITNFHFEIAADLLNEEELKILSQMRPGLVQLEIGVQTTNMQTLKEINRKTDLEKIKQITAKIHSFGNIHQHLDLIAGLPYEGYDSLIQSFCEIYKMRPNQLQLGFLKVLKGSKMYHKAEEYGISYRSFPQYEVLFTKWLSHDELLNLKKVEEMVEVYYNSFQFSHTIHALEKEFSNPFEMFLKLGEYYEKKGLNHLNHSRMGRFEILRDFILELKTGKEKWYEEWMIFDLYLRENSKSRPNWAKDCGTWKEFTAWICKKEERQPEYLTGYEGYTYRQIIKMTHLEIFSINVLGEGERKETAVLFDYRKKDPLNGNASVYQIEKIK